MTITFEMIGATETRMKAGLLGLHPNTEMINDPEGKSAAVYTDDEWIRELGRRYYNREVTRYERDQQVEAAHVAANAMDTEGLLH